MSLSTNVTLNIDNIKLDVIVVVHCDVYIDLSNIIAKVTQEYFDSKPVLGIFQAQSEYIVLHQMKGYVQRAVYKIYDTVTISAVEIKIPYKQAEITRSFKLPIYDGYIDVPINIKMHYQGQYNEDDIFALVLNSWDPHRILDRRIKVLNKINHNINILNTGTIKVIDYRVILADPNVTTKQLERRQFIHNMITPCFDVYVLFVLLGILAVAYHM